MGFTVNHTVRFQETDGAGVVYFANGLTICHGAYEASLAAVGMDLVEFFGRGSVAYPIVRATIDFWHPMRCGDRLQICLQPTRLDQSSFQVQYQIMLQGQLQKPVAEALTRHVCIATHSRQRQPLATEMEVWLQRWAD